MIGLDVHKAKYYHLGYGRSVTRSNLAKANEKLHYKIFEGFAYHLIDQGRECSEVKDFDLAAIEIALLYKYPWKIKLFLKRVKQHLKIKLFWGTIPNAGKMQIYSAIIAYCLVVIMGNKLKVERSIYQIFRILSISLLDKTPLKEPLTNHDYKNVKELNYIQLKIRDF